MNPNDMRGVKPVGRVWLPMYRVAVFRRVVDFLKYLFQHRIIPSLCKVSAFQCKQEYRELNQASTPMMDSVDVASNHPPSPRYYDTKLSCDKELIVYIIVPKHVLPGGISDTTKFQSVFLTPQSSGFVLTSSILNSKNYPPTNFHIYFVSFGLFPKTTSIFFQSQYQVIPKPPKPSVV